MTQEFDENEIDKVIANFLERGLIEIHGVESLTGEITYRITEKCKEEYPELFEEHFSFVNEMAFILWQKGYIEMKFDDDGLPMVMLKDLDYVNDVYPNLSREERYFIENMIYMDQNKGDII